MKKSLLCRKSTSWRWQSSNDISFGALFLRRTYLYLFTVLQKAPSRLSTRDLCSFCPRARVPKISLYSPVTWVQIACSWENVVGALFIGWLIVSLVGAAGNCWKMETEKVTEDYYLRTGRRHFAAIFQCQAKRRTINVTESIHCHSPKSCLDGSICTSSFFSFGPLHTKWKQCILTIAVRQGL